MSSATLLSSVPHKEKVLLYPCDIGIGQVLPSLDNGLLVEVTQSGFGSVFAPWGMFFSISATAMRRICFLVPRQMKNIWNRVTTAKSNLNMLISSSPTGTWNKINNRFKSLSLEVVFHTVVVGWYSHLVETPWRWASDGHYPWHLFWTSDLVLFNLCFIISAQPSWLWVLVDAHWWPSPCSYLLLISTSSCPPKLWCWFLLGPLALLLAGKHPPSPARALVWSSMGQNSQPFPHQCKAQIEASNGIYQATGLSHGCLTPDMPLT